jgi:hypothetical protein
LVAVAGAAVAACAPIHVNSYAERGADFTRYHTYSWAADDQLRTNDPRLDNNPFFLARLRSDVDKQLAAKGFERVENGASDLVLHYHASVMQKLDLASVDQKYAANTGGPYVYDAGTLLLDFVDTRANTIAWRAWAEGSMDGAIDNQEWMEARIDLAVARMLERFPHRL